MQRSELEGLVAVYERGFAAIQEILEDDEIRARDKIDAICEVVFDENEDENQDGNAAEAAE